MEYGVHEYPSPSKIYRIPGMVIIGAILIHESHNDGGRYAGSTRESSKKDRMLIAVTTTGFQHFEGRG